MNINLSYFPKTSGLHKSLVSWYRDSIEKPKVGESTVEEQSKQGCSCLWYKGFIANRGALIRNYKLASNIPDSDLLVHLYQQYHDNAAQYIEGTFAWVLWDSVLQMLVIARDTVGNTGLFYAIRGQQVLVSDSEENVLASESVGIDNINLVSIATFLYGKAPPPGQTFYQDIHAIRPGEIVTITRETITRRVYWCVQPQITLTLASDEEYAEALRSILFQVIGEYVPQQNAAITLSGGMDSTTVAAVLRSVTDIDIKAISSLAPELPAADESERIYAAAKHIQLPITTLRGDLLWPFHSVEAKTTRSSPFFFYYSELWNEIFRTAVAEDFKVLFSGMGGDHLFGGKPPIYLDLLFTGSWTKFLQRIKEQSRNSQINLSKLILQMVIKPFFKYLNPFQKKQSISSEPWVAKKSQCIMREYQSHYMPARNLSIPPGRKFRYDFYKNPTISYHMDMMNRRASGFGVDFRHPLMDRRLTEFALSLPVEQTYHYPYGKWIVRNAMRGYLPDEVLTWSGRVTPLAIFSRGMIDREKEKVYTLLKDMRAADLGFVDERLVNLAYEDYVCGKNNRGSFWQALVLEDWLRRYF